jgi:signal transduction histidine kinase
MRQLIQLQEIRNKISKDLHDEIGSTLSSISIFSEVAKKITKKESPEAESVLNNIGDSARSSIDSMSDIVWAINPKNDRFQNVIDRIKLFANQLMDAKNISFKIDFPSHLGELKLPMQHRKNIYLVLKEALNNIAKYSQATSCRISVEKLNKQMKIAISDDGVGFDSTPESLGGNGLINMKQRIEELSGTFEIQSAKKQGTTLFIKFNL